MVIWTFAVLIVVNAVLIRLEWEIKVLTMSWRHAVLILRLNVLQQLVNSNMRWKILCIRSENVEQLFVDVVFRELVFAGVRIEKSWSRLMHRRKVWKSRVVAIVNIFKFIIIVC